MFFMQKNPVYLTLNKDELILDLELLCLEVLQYICRVLVSMGAATPTDLRYDDFYTLDFNEFFQK